MMIEEEEQEHSLAEEYEVEHPSAHQSLLLEIFTRNPQELATCINSLVDKDKYYEFSQSLAKLDSNTKTTFAEVFTSKIMELMDSLQPNEEGAYFTKQTGQNLLQLIEQVYFIESQFPLTQLLSQKLFGFLKKVTNCEDISKLLILLPRIHKAQASSMFAQLQLLENRINTKMEPSPTEQAFKIEKVYSSLSEEEQLSIQVELQIALNCFEEGKGKLNQEKIQEKINVLQVKPYQKLFGYLIAHKDIKIINRFKEKLIETQIVEKEGNLVYSFKAQIHQQLQTVESLEKVVKHSMSNQLLNHLLKGVFVEVGSKLVSIWNFKMLEEVREKILYTGEDFSRDVFHSFVGEFLKAVKRKDQGLHLVIRPNELEEEGRDITAELLINAFQLVAKYFRKFYGQADELYMPDLITEGLVLSMINEVRRVIEIPAYKRSKLIQEAASDLYFFSVLIFFRRNFQAFARFDHPVSKALVKLMIAQENFPLEWSKLKMIKAIIDRWAETVDENSEHFKLIFRKFFAAYFNPKVIVTSKSNSSAFNPVFMSRSYNNILSAQFTEFSQQIFNMIKNTKQDEWTEQALSEKEVLVSKIGMILYSSPKLKNVNKIADLMRTCYARWAHLLSPIYSFRLWIIEHSTRSTLEDTEEFSIEELILSSQQDLKKLETLINELPLPVLLSKDIRVMQEAQKRYSAVTLKIEQLKNCMQLKKLNQRYAPEVYEKYLALIFKLLEQQVVIEKGLQLYAKDNNQEYKITLVQNCMSPVLNLYDRFHKLLFDLKMVLRCLICNSDKFLGNKDQTDLFHLIGLRLCEDLKNERIKVYPQYLNAYNDILGNGALEENSHLQRKQMSNSKQRNTLQISKDLYVPLNQVASLYNSIRKNYLRIIETLLSLQKFQPKNSKQQKPLKVLLAQHFGQVKEQRERRISSEAKTLLNSLLFPPVNTGGPCWFNGKYLDKGRDQIVYGIYFDQFKEIASLPIEQLTEIDSNIFKQLLEIFLSKERKIVAEKDPRVNKRQNRNHHRMESMTRYLRNTGIPEQILQIAIQNIQEPQPEAIMEWIENNRHRIQNILQEKAIERSKKEMQSSGSKFLSPLHNQNVTELSKNEFQENVQKLMKELIKPLNKYLFSEKGQKMKELIMIFLDAFKSDSYKKKQYANFSKKMIEELKLLTHGFDPKIAIVADILDRILSKKTQLIHQFYQNGSHIDLIRIIGNLNTQPGCSLRQHAMAKVLHLVQVCMPLFKPDQKIDWPQLANYYRSLLYTLKDVNICGSHQYFIFLKLISLKQKDILSLTAAIVAQKIQSGVANQDLNHLIKLILNQNNNLVKLNVEAHIKGILLNKFRVDVSNGKTQFEIDLRFFTTGFQKHDLKTFKQTLLMLLEKKPKSNKMCIYNAKKHSFYKSDQLEIPFVAFEPQKEHRRLLDSLINYITTRKQGETPVLYIEWLYDILSKYNLLIPYVAMKKVSGVSFIIWIVTNFDPQCQKKYDLLTLLCMHNNLQIDINLSFCDYVLTTIIGHLIATNISISNQKKKANYWKFMPFLYLAQLKRFHQYVKSPLSKLEPTSLLETMENLISTNDPIKYTLSSECAYLVHKKKLIDSLKGKYNIVDSQQSHVQSQFLFMSLFYKDKTNRDSDADSFKDRHRNSRMALDDDQEQSQYAQMEDPIDIRELLRRRFQQNEPSVQEYWRIFRPIEVANLPNEEVEPMLQVRLQGQQNIEGQAELIVEEPKVVGDYKQQTSQSLEDIIKKIEILLPHYQEDVMVFDFPKVETPEESLAVTDKEIFGSIKPQKDEIYYFHFLSKTRAFQKRLVELATLIDPHLSWAIKEASNSKNSRGQQLVQMYLNRRGLGQGFQTEIIDQIERLVWRRTHEEQEPPLPQINLNDLVSLLPQYVAEPPKEDRMEIQPKQSVNVQAFHEEERIENALKNEELQDVLEHQELARDMDQPPVSEQNKIIKEEANEKIQHPSEDKYKNPSQEKLLLEQEKPEIKVGQEQKNVEKVQIKPGQHSEGKKEQCSQIEADKTKQIQAEELSEHPQVKPESLELQEDKMVEEAHKEHEQALMEEPKNEIHEQYDGPQREILTMFGLPQTFLMDVGLDVESFDQLPEDLQIDQITHYMNQQNLQGQSSQTNERPMQQMNEGVASDQFSENVAFIASLDPQLRAQVLIEATPEFLLNLPPEYRAEAENHRQRQISQIVEMEEMNQRRDMMHESGLNSRDIKYPKLEKKDFPQMPQSVARELMRAIFINLPSFQPQTPKLLLDNKHTQKKAVTTLLMALELVKQKQVFKFMDVNYNQEKEQYESCHSKMPAKNLEAVVLNLVNSKLKTSVFKDNDFLLGKYSYQSFSQGKLSIKPELEADIEGYYPLYYLLWHSIEHYPSLSVQLIKKVEVLPTALVKKVLEGMKNDRLASEFYHHLECVQRNEEASRLFLQQFPQEKAPKIQTLGRILKYGFAKVPYLKDVHEVALKNYLSSYNEFLNQIFSIYSLEQLRKMEGLLLKHKNVHFNVIQYLYANGRPLDQEPMGIILKMPHLLDFQTKKFLFRKHPKIRANKGYRLNLQVNRANIFQESFNQIMSKTPKQLQGRLKITFIDEPGYDAGGITREWLMCLSKQIFNADYALFEPSSSGNTYQPNPKSLVNPEHLNYFKFIGRFTAKALAQNELIDAYFTRSFYKMILGQEIEFQDIEQQDYNFYKSMKWLEENPIEEGAYTFSYLYDNFGKRVMKELVPGGKDLNVTDANKREFIEKYCLANMRDSFSAQMGMFLEGFHEIIPRECISFFQAKDLQLLISGLPAIDIEDLRNNVDYSGYTPTDDPIKWFWEVVENYSQEDLARLIQFITGTSKIPVEGFGHIRGMNGPQRISIHKDSLVYQLPKAHTCFNQLDLPNYPSKAVLEEKLRVAITWGSEGFGFM